MLGIDAAEVSSHRAPWNKGRLIGQKRPLKPKEVWTIRVRLQLEERRRDLALFNLALDSKLRGCDLVRLQVNDVCVGGRVRDRATVIQRKTGRPVQFEITEQTRAAIRDWVANSVPGNGQYLFPSRFHDQPHISTRQYARIVHRWVERAGLDSISDGIPQTPSGGGCIAAPISPRPRVIISINALRSKLSDIARRRSGLSKGGLSRLTIRLRALAALTSSQITCDAWLLLSLRMCVGASASLLRSYRIALISSDTPARSWSRCGKF